MNMILSSSPHFPLLSTTPSSSSLRHCSILSSKSICCCCCCCYNSNYLGSKRRALLQTKAQGTGGEEDSSRRRIIQDQQNQNQNQNQNGPILVREKDVPLEGVIQFDKPRKLSLLQRYGRVSVLVAGDVLFLLLFASVGRWSHGFSVYSVETLQTADPFIAGWLLSSYFLGGYGPDGKGMNGVPKAAFAAAKSWAAGIPLGLIIRSSTSGHIPPTPFILVSMGSTAVLLVGWRVLLTSVFPDGEANESEKVYRRGSPFELFELLASLVRRW